MVKGSVALGHPFVSTWEQVFQHTFKEDVDCTVELYSEQGESFGVRVNYTRASSSGYQFQLTSSGAIRIPLQAKSMTVEVANRGPGPQTVTGGVSEGAMPANGPYCWSQNLMGVSSERDIELVAGAESIHVSVGDETRHGDVLIKTYRGIADDDGVVATDCVGAWTADKQPPSGIPVTGVHKVTVQVTNGDSLDIISHTYITF